MPPPFEFFIKVVQQQIQPFIRKGRTTLASADFCTPSNDVAPEGRCADLSG